MSTRTHAPECAKTKALSDALGNMHSPLFVRTECTCGAEYQHSVEERLKETEAAAERWRQQYTGANYSLTAARNQLAKAESEAASMREHIREAKRAIAENTNGQGCYVANNILRTALGLGAQADG